MSYTSITLEQSIPTPSRVAQNDANNQESNDVAAIVAESVDRVNTATAIVSNSFGMPPTAQIIDGEV